MRTWIALLRGINVGGKNILPMKELRALLESLNLENVRTYIQSGNCIFECEETDAKTLVKSIADSIEKAFQFCPQVMVLTKNELETAILGNPYPDCADDPKNIHLFFLSEPANESDLKTLGEVKKPSECFILIDQVFYLHTPEGFHGSKLAAKVEKCLGVVVTARNLRSAIKIAELSN